MKTQHSAAKLFFRMVFLSLFLVMTAPASAQNAQGITRSPLATGPDPRAIEQFRLQYDTMMSNFERLAVKQGNKTAQSMAQEGRAAMSRLTDQQVGLIYSQTHNPDLSAGVVASELAASRQVNAQLKSLPFPDADAIVSGCDGVAIDAPTRYALFITKEVTNSILAAAAWVCNEDILGENGSLACVPLAIAADIANGFFDTATFCAGEVTANQVDANYRRLEHIHNDLSASITTIMNNDNANTTNIINNDNANTTNILNNANANRDTLIGEIRALGCEIVRLLNTPEGLRASSILACSAQPGYPYSWNKK